ncbi:MAG: GDSL-type esterase/lipase family protein [Gemmatimonadota bacterium]|nr:GDSL-type esterase/lipase family protein [Gemmatimonadota bacterium]
MSIIRSLVRAGGAFALAGVALSCDHSAELFMPEPADDIFRSYVALGNSITAGFQAGGINDATQQLSYAVLLGRQMRTRFAYPSFAMPGCPAPIVDWRTEARLGAPAAPPCAFRNTELATEVLNNVAVPSAGVTEVHSDQSPYHDDHTTLVLGGKTQVERALDARPTFATIWIGNNDALHPATAGMVPPPPGIRGITPQATFTQKYDEMINDLLTGAPGIKGVLIGVVRVPSAPRFFPVTAFQDATFRTELGNRVGGSITVHPNCTTQPGAGVLVSWEIVRRMRMGEHPRLIVCEKNTPGVPAPVGDIFIIDAAEQAALNMAVDDYNSYLQQKANAIGFAYYDPNPTLLAERRTGGCFAVIPNPAAAASGSPFGSCMSNDGVHPAAAGQRLIANALIVAINAKYATTLPAVP